jgi:Leucine Rich repeat
MELLGISLLAVGLVLAAVGAVWLLVLAFRESYGWGFGLLVFPPLGLVYLFRSPRRTVVPIVLMILASLFLAAPFALNALDRLRPLEAYRSVVDGEKHLTLTGWSESDYALLDGETETVVLQMANADVTDDTLRHLKGMDRLRELDLNGTQVTDRGLDALKGLGRLEELRLSRTAVTDAGVRAFLGAMPALKKIDLRGTTVAAATLRKWKNAGEGRAYLK